MPEPEVLRKHQRCSTGRPGLQGLSSVQQPRHVSSLGRGEREVLDDGEGCFAQKLKSLQFQNLYLLHMAGIGGGWLLHTGGIWGFTQVGLD